MDSLLVWRIVFVAVAVTPAVTLLRLVGELRQWSRALFNPSAGGGAALVGIVWLASAASQGLFAPFDSSSWWISIQAKSPPSTPRARRYPAASWLWKTARKDARTRSRARRQK